MPGVLRSNSPLFRRPARRPPDHGPPPPGCPHGLNSPIGRVYELDGQVLLLGIDHTANTTIHRRSPYLACATGARSTSLLQNGQPTRFDYGEIDHCCQNFALVDGWLDARGFAAPGNRGDARGRGWRSRDVVAVVIERLRQDETAFLHPLGLTRNATKRWPPGKGEPDPLQAVRQQVFQVIDQAVERGQEAACRRRPGAGAADLGGQVRRAARAQALNLFEQPLGARVRHVVEGEQDVEIGHQQPGHLIVDKHQVAPGEGFLQVIAVAGNDPA